MKIRVILKSIGTISTVTHIGEAERCLCLRCLQSKQRFGIYSAKAWVCRYIGFWADTSIVPYTSARGDVNGRLSTSFPREVRQELLGEMAGFAPLVNVLAPVHYTVPITGFVLLFGSIIWRIVRACIRKNA